MGLLLLSLLLKFANAERFKRKLAFEAKMKKACLPSKYFCKEALVLFFLILF